MSKKEKDVIVFKWEGINRRGEITKGEQEAKSVAIVKADLRKQGIIAKKVSKKRDSLFSKKNAKIQGTDITFFARQLATMIQSGIPLIQSFDIVSKGQSNERMSKLIDTIKLNVESGGTLAESLAKHPEHFNELFCNLVDAGEQSGSLEMMLDNVATYKEKVDSIKRKIKKALYYPIAVLMVAFLVSAALLIYVVPQFEDLFKGFGADLPAMTRVVVQLSEAMQAYWYIIFSVVGGLGYAFVYFKKHSPKFAYTIDRISLKVPIIGSILKKASIARFARTLSITFAAGMPLIDALKSVAGATGNILYTNATIAIRDEVVTGSQMQSAMNKTGMFPNMVVQMVAIGEESGNIESMLSKVADFYEEEVDTAVDSLSSLIEPLIMVVIGGLVGGLVIAMYLPIFKLGAVV
jgi:type IV pilus assembly protein PilC